MAEGINFTSEAFDDDDAESSDKKKKKKKASKDVGTAIVTASVESSEATEKPKPGIFDQLRGLFTEAVPEKEAEKANAPEATEKAENLETALSGEEDATLSQPEAVPVPDMAGSPEQPADFREFRTELHSDELSSGEGVIELHSSDEEIAPEVTVPARSVEGDPATAEPVEAPDEAITPPQTPAKTPTGGRGRTAASSPQGQPSGHAGGSGGGTLPNPAGIGNTPPPGGGNQAPRGPSTPNVIIIPGAQGGNALTNPNNPNTSPATLLAQHLARETTPAAARDKGRVEGLIAGAVIGGGIEHIRHKRYEKKLKRQTKKAFAERDKKIENLEYHQQQLKTEHREMVRKADADKRQVRQAAQAEMARTVEEQMALVRSENSAAVDAAKHAAELKEAERKKAETIERLNAQAMEQERQEVEKLQGPENRLETSAWHTMEVDKHGHVVEQSKLVYGHEYYRERSHEITPVEQFDAKAGAAVVSALVGSASNDDGTPATSHQTTPGWGPLPATPPATVPRHQTTTDDAPATLDVGSLVPWILLLLAVGIAIWIAV